MELTAGCCAADAKRQNSQQQSVVGYMGALEITISVNSEVAYTRRRSLHRLAHIRFHWLYASERIKFKLVVIVYTDLDI